MAGRGGVGAGLLARRAGGIGARLSAHGGCGTGLTGDVVTVFHGLGHLLALALLFKAGCAVGVDALLGEVVGRSAGYISRRVSYGTRAKACSNDHVPTQREPHPSLQNTE